jgi:mannitol-specific phosphotransferase system IIBC component
MFQVIAGLVAAILVLIIVLLIVLRVAKTRGQKLSAATEALNLAKAELEKAKNYMVGREEAQKNAENKKDTLHSGDSANNFDSSLGLLHSASKGS